MMLCHEIMACDRLSVIESIPSTSNSLYAPWCCAMRSWLVTGYLSWSLFLTLVTACSMVLCHEIMACDRLSVMESIPNTSNSMYASVLPRFSKGQGAI